MRHGKMSRKRFFAAFLSMAVMTASVEMPMAAPYAQEEADYGEEQQPSVSADDGEENVTYINFEEIANEDYTVADAGVDVSVKYEKNTATVTGNKWKATWGGGEQWGVQLKELIPVAKSSQYEVSFDITSQVARTVGVKLGDVNEDGTMFSEEADLNIPLSANTLKHYTIKSKEVTIDELMVLFALGDTQNNEYENTITISNLSLKNLTTGEYVVGTRKPDSKGEEYDFSATADNQANDTPAAKQGKDGYDLIWADEFDGNYGDANVDEATGLNLDNWACQLGDGATDCGNQGWGNAELQCYRSVSENVCVNEDLDGDGENDGLLRITATYNKDGYKYESESTKKYASARLRTTKAEEELFNTTYGYIEGRMSLPQTKGAWPAFWMLPQSTDIYGGWPVSGEIDIMETCGAFEDGKNNQACGTLHWGGPEHVYKGSGYVELKHDIKYFHTYAVEWEPGKITWYYDGEAINTLTNWKSAFAGASDALSFDAPFDMPYYMLLNLAVDSGRFGGKANKANFQDDINMYVDYVRVYQKTGGYPESVVRTASDDTKDDWEKYAGKNQIAEIKADNLDTTGGGMNDTNADINKWYLSNQEDAPDATAEVIQDKSGKNWVKVGVNTQGANDYSVQLIGHYNAKAGYVYRVSFDAYADGGLVGKICNSDSKEWKGWSAYGIQSFELKNKAESYSYIFEHTEDFDNCRIEFNLGAQASGNVYVGNVKVEIVDPATLGSENESRKPLKDGNLIYNGSFDQGDYHTGYWMTGKGTKISVPRYTTAKVKDSDVCVVDVASKKNYEKIADGVKYYERRAQISAEKGTSPTVFQTGLVMPADSYTLDFDVYSKADMVITAAIYSVKDDGESLDRQIISTSTDYKAQKGLSHCRWSFDTAEKLDSAALVLSFGDGASVQIDNVAMIGASLAEKVDETPMDPSKIKWTTWHSDSQNDSVALEEKDGAHVATVTSGTGTDWYAPQIVSDDYSLASGKTYKLSFKYKMEGTSNNTFEYFVQENGGSWTGFSGNGPTKVQVGGVKDGDGYYTYEVTFTAPVSSSNVHMVFGFGNSAAKDCIFTYKDVTMTLADNGTEEPGGEDDSIAMPKSYTIAYMLDGGTNAASNPAGYTQGDGIITLQAPTKAGYTFLGWSIAKKGAPYVTTLDKKQAGPIVLYANWQAAKKTAGTITVAANIVTKTYGDKAFNLGAKGQGTLTYTSSNEKVVTVDSAGNVTIKGAGSAVITIESTGDASHTAATATVTVKVAPKKVTGVKVKSKKAKKATVSWKKDAQATGYEIQYSTNKKFKNAKTVWITKNSAKKPSKTLSKLKAGKKYYVRIRAYANKSKNDRVYGEWVTKTVKVKK